MKKIFATILTALVVSSSATAATRRDSVAMYTDFLYDIMPVSDSIDYPRDFWEANVARSLETRAAMPWGAKIPEREFRHFVLPVRVNNENMDMSRIVFYDELAPRVAGMSMADAALEVNHWCHEKATYAPSDGRTSSPLATVRTTLGRCGEESTFAVAALRSVGIPARQVYTPRWAHTDDNHAWVEVWVDGRWHFLGACEPEPLLDMAWFNAPASRGMLMSTNVAGHYDGPEQQLYADSCYTRINVTSNYAPVRRAEVTVLGPDGTPAKGARVTFRLYNYAEFYPVFTTTADADGRARLICGRGDLLAWAADNDGNYAFGCYGADADGLTLRLAPDGATSWTEGSVSRMTLTPPAQSGSLPKATEAQTADNNRRKAYEDSVRNARMATFYDTARGEAFAATLGPTARGEAQRIGVLLSKAYGNSEVWIDALRRTDDARIPALLDWAATLSDKDLRDIPAEVIDDMFTPARTVSPRIANELLTPFCGAFDRLVSQELRDSLRANPQSIPQWIAANISDASTFNPNRYCISPAGVFRARQADTRSRNIFFVALCRWLGIPADIDAVTGNTRWNPDGTALRPIALGQSAATAGRSSAGTGRLRLSYTGSVPKAPRYYSHFSICRLDGGMPRQLEYPEETFADTFAGGTELEAGPYVLVTGRRLADGGVLTRMERFDITGGTTVDLPMVIDDDPSELSVIGSINADPLLPVTGRGFFVYAVISPGHEPTVHLLNELKANRETLEAWSGRIVLMFADSDAASRFTPAMSAGLPSNVAVVTEPQPDRLREVAVQFGFEPDASALPAVIVGDTFNRVVYHSEGYLPGLADRLIDIIHRLP